MEKIHAYWKQKSQHRDPNAIVQPLWADFSEPLFWQVGQIIEIHKGHTMEFDFNDEIKVNTHLMAANFGDMDTSNYMHEMAQNNSRLQSSN